MDGGRLAGLALTGQSSPEIRVSAITRFGARPAECWSRLAWLARI
jgi:hypothetical protein